MQKLVRLAAIAALLVLPGCDSIFGSGERDLRREGIIAYQGLPVVANVPLNATVGVPFQVVVRTYGPGCYSFGGTNVVEAAEGIQVLPFDYLNVGGTDACPASVQEFSHTAQITINAPGEAKIIFLGQSVQSTGASRARSEHRVQVAAAP